MEGVNYDSIDGGDGGTTRRTTSTRGSWQRRRGEGTRDAMTDNFQVPTAVVLRRAAGLVELAELLVDGESTTFPAARKLLVRALDEVRSLPHEDRLSRSASLLEGEALRALGEWESALVPLERAADGPRGRVEAAMGLGWCFKRLGRIADAISVLRRAIEANPDQPVLHYNLACYHSVAGDVAAAIEHLTRAITMDGRFRDLTGTERDFDAIRTDPRFVAATVVTV